MSRQSLLPPRCPFQKHSFSLPVPKSFVQHHKSPSQSSILEDQPAWLDDLLNDQDADAKGNLHRRSASDSITLLDGLADSFSGLSPGKDLETSVGNEICDSLESASMYGPNSPRRRGNVSFSENAIVSALSEYVVQKPPQYIDGNLCISGSIQTDPIMDAGSTVDDTNGETTTGKRHSGQRSRVRKLQYIAELERSVDALQTLESELAIRVASSLQERVALSIENNKLKQQLARLRQEKVIMEGQYKSLKKELERLKNSLAASQSSKLRKYVRSGSPPESAGTWKMLDMANLYLN